MSVPPPPTHSGYPAISIVIPMYNTEKYIGACLTSILNQTFQNFEVIVVDDCSTDNSCAVVESFIPKFEGRLKLLHMPKNSGGSGKPSNKGIINSIGKYLFIMDNDDLIFDSTLELLYTTAEKFNVDLVYMEQGFKFSGDENKMFPDPENLERMGWQGRGPFVDKPTLDSENISERIEIFLQSRMGWPVWEKFFRRSLITENEIKFPNLKSSQDIIFTIELMCHAKKILRVPYPLYVYRRNNPKSILATERENAEKIIFWCDINLQGLKFLTDFFDTQKFFAENPQYQIALLEFWEGVHLDTVRNIIQNVPPHEVYGILKKIFTEKFGEHGNLIARLCQSSNLLRYNFQMAMQRIRQLEEEVKKLQNDK